jgi:hypothetical protein
VNDEPHAVTPARHDEESWRWVEQLRAGLALRLGSNRNAIYKNLFDARRSLRTSLASAGHPVIEEDAITP